MNSVTRDFPEISLLITHFNRPDSLKRLLVSFNELNCNFGEIVVSDDCSKPDNLKQLELLKDEFEFNLVTTPVNKGLGNNINKGQAAVHKKYTLYVQEDFVPLPLFPEKLVDAINFLETDKELDVVRFYAYQLFPYLIPVGNGFSEMIFNPTNILGTYNKFYAYSDHPHLRRSEFLRKFGEYKEGVNVEKAEYSMMMSFLKKKGRGLFYEDYKGLFDQKNSADEPSTFKRNWKRNPNNLLIRVARHLYRHAKFNIDYFS
ncbi:glycosyltransferase family 2 protein [Pedobacter sp. PWIIR3]